MAYPETHYRWEWQLKSSPEQFWPFISDTNRFNRDTGLPVVEVRANEEPLRHSQRRLRIFRLGIPVEWVEEPFEWIRPHRFGVVRRYLSGPVDEMRVATELTPLPGGGSKFVYQVWVRPKNLLGIIAIPLQIGLLSAYSFDAAVRRYDALIARKGAPLELPGSTTFSPGGRLRLTATRQALLNEHASPELVAKLGELIEKADDLSLSRIRPYVLADYWGVPRRTVLELFLLAAHVGMLELRWDVMCPLCRVSKAGDDSLKNLLAPVHCDTCNIDFSANLDRSVELSFRPHPAIRKAELREYCLAGPQVTPHIIAQQLVPAKERRTVILPLQQGRYRFRALELRGGQFFTVSPDGAPNLAIRATEAGWPTDEPRLSPSPTLLLENATNREQLVIMEHTAWSDQLVTAAEVTPNRLFRELFAKQTIQPGEEVSVGNLTVAVFGIGNTSRSINGDDAPVVSIGLLQLVKAAIEYEQGTFVRIDGDEVLAVFPRPLAALRAAVNLMVEPGQQIRVAIHHGPCIGVMVDDRLEYRGGTVALAQRVVKNSPRGSIVLTAPVSGDAHAAKYLANIGEHIKLEPFLGVLKGFDTEGFEMWEIRFKEIDASQRVTILRL